MKFCETGIMSSFEGPKGSGNAPDRGSDLSATESTSLSIDNVARMFRLSRLTLWVYERLGLIKRRNRIGKDLLYAWTDCDRLAFIVKGRSAGLRVHQVRPIIKGLEPTASDESIRLARTRCVELIDLLDRRHQILRAALAELRYLDSQLSKANGIVRDRVPLDPD